MKWLSRPDLWFALALVVLTAAGGELLSRPECTQLSERDRNSYGQRPRWQMHFDALSAVCGVGLLTYDVREDYASLGRWVLAGLGVAGAILYLAASRRAMGRLWPELPRLRAILCAYAAAQILVIPYAALAERLAGADTGLGDAAWHAVGAFSSLGFWSRTPGSGSAWIYALPSLLGALGWPVWLGVARRKVLRRGLLGVLLAYAVFLVACGGLIAALEAPRTSPRGHVGEGSRSAAAAPHWSFGRSLTQVLCASGAGLQTENLSERAVSEGTKCVLALVVLVGGPGGAAGGGIHWTAAFWAVAAALVIRGPWWSADDGVRRVVFAGTGCAALLILLWAIVALGLLLIETRIGSAFQSPPTFADALVDAASAVGGAGLTSGLTTTVTSANLSIGIRQNVDLYQYGMAWIMLAMFLGRVLPVWVVRRCADFRFTDARPALPALI